MIHGASPAIPNVSNIQYDYRIYNGVDSNCIPYYEIQRRQKGSHHFRYLWNSFTNKIFKVDEREEAEKILKHLQENNSP